MQVESLTRIVILIPVPSTDSMFCHVDDLMTELLDVSDGVTSSINEPSVFRGTWVNKETLKKESDYNLYIFSDAPFSLDDSDLPDWLEWLADLKLWCQNRFNQDIIWMTIQRVERIATDDYKKTYPREDSASLNG